jgi:hypothetical protein
LELDYLLNIILSISPEQAVEISVILYRSTPLIFRTDNTVFFLGATSQA